MLLLIMCKILVWKGLVKDEGSHIVIGGIPLRDSIEQFACPSST